MARQFDGANDNISFGSDASVDDFAQKSALMFIRPDVGGATTDDLLTKSDGNAVTPTGWQFSYITSALSSGHLQFTQDFTLTDGTWITPNNSAPNTNIHHVAFTYDRGATGNDPNIYVDGTLQAETEVGTPTGSSGADAAQNLKAGEDDGGNNDYGSAASSLGFLVYDSTLFTAAQVNRHRWHGHPGGLSSVDVWQPMWTDSLTNKGTATANGTATGTTMADAGVAPDLSIPRVERAWGASMGCGR